VGEGDKLLVSADRNPNVRGALVVGLIAELPKVGDAAPSPRQANGGEGAAAPVRLGGLSALAADIDAGKTKVVVAINEDLAAAGLTAAQLAKVAIIHLGTHANATSAAAKVVLPTLTVFEKSGTFVNQQFRLQKFQQAIPGAAGATNDLVVLAKLVSAVSGTPVASDLGSIWKALAAAVPVLGPVTYVNLPETGLLLDPTPFAGLPFVEGETLHFKPAVPAAATA
jgi:NADH-quinone oxidoreductase subunit G